MSIPKFSPFNFPPASAGGAATALDNPSASISNTAVNGVAITAMRSDAAPALASTGLIINRWTFTAPATAITLTGTDNQTYTLPSTTDTLLGKASAVNITNFALRDTSAAFDVTLTATSGSALTAGRTLTLDMGNVAHSVVLGTTSNTITFPSTASYTVAGLNVAQTFTALQTFTPAANTAQITTTGSHTGSDATSDFTLSTTLNTSGSPDVFKIAVTDTARGASTKLFNIYAGASGTTSIFSVDRAGNLINGNPGVNIGNSGSAPTIALNTSGQIQAFVNSNAFQVVGGNIKTKDSAYISSSSSSSLSLGTTSGGTDASLLLQIANSTKTSNYTVLTTDTNKHFDNTGAGGEVDFTLPTAAAGLTYYFAVTAAQTLKVIAVGSDKIAIGASNSAAAGNISANAVYAFVVIEAHGTIQWIARASTGTWTVT